MSESLLTTEMPLSSQFFAAKARKGLTFAELGKAIDRDEVWVAAAFYGQAKFELADIEKLLNVLDLKNTLPLSSAAISAYDDQWWPQRGLGPMPPTDPLIYRLYEAVLVYGTAIKAVIHEKCGDGIMSMIDCKVHAEKKPDPKGDRIVLSFDGKFLSYAKW